MNIRLILVNSESRKYASPIDVSHPLRVHEKLHISVSRDNECDMTMVMTVTSRTPRYYKLPISRESREAAYF